MSSIASTVIQTLVQIGVQKTAQHLIDMTQTKEQLGADAAGAAVGAGKSAADIPYVGWLLAIGAMASVFAAASSYKAEGGFDVPAGLRPTTTLHPREMVLPAGLADRVRAVTPNADGSGGLGGGGNLQVHLKAFDTRDVARALKRGGILEKAIRDLYHSGAHRSRF